MTDKTVVPFPIKTSTRYRNRLGQLAVPCEVSERWLEFDPTSHRLRGGEFIGLSVMTRGRGGDERTLCGLWITREELTDVLSRVKPSQEGS